MSYSESHQILWQNSKFVSRVCIFVCAIFAVRPYFVFLSSSSIIPPSLYGDYGSLQLPLREFLRSEILAGRLPLWIPYLGCGMPLHASQQASLMYPLLTPFVVLFGANVGIKFSIFLHVLIAYSGQFLLCRKFGISVFASCFAGIVVAQSGFITSHLMVGHITVVVAYCWLPWLIVAILNLSRQPSPRSAAVLALVTIMLVLSHPQIAYYAALLGFVCAIASLRSIPSSLQRKRYVIWLTFGIVLALLVIAVQAFPTIELLRDGMQTSVRKSSNFASSFSLDPTELSRFVVPRINGLPFASSFLFDPNDAFHEETPYVGILPLLLFLYAISREKAKTWEMMVGLFVLFAMLISLGDSTPFFNLAKTWIPGFSLFRCPGRIFALTSILIPLIAASGLDRLVDQTKPAGGLRAIALAICLFLISNVLGWYILKDMELLFSSEYKEHFWMCGFREVQIAAVLIAVSCFVLWSFARSKKNQWIPATMLIALLVVDLEYSSAASIQLTEAQPRILPSYVTENITQYRFFDASNESFGIENQLRYSKMVSAAIAQSAPMLGANEGGVFPESMQRLHRAIARRPDDLLPIASCRFILHPNQKWEELSGTIDRIRFIPEDDSPVASIPIEEIRLNNIPKDTGFKYEVLYEDSGRLILNVDCPTAGIVGVGDTYFPGWNCEIDGHQISILPLHEVFRCVKMGTGKHRVEFIYDPPSFEIGKWFALLGIAGILGCLLRRDPIIDEVTR